MNTIYFLFTIFVSSVLQGITGFGFALLAAPLGLLFFDQQTVVVVLTVCSFALNFYLLSKIKEKIDKIIVSRLVVSGFFGVPIGVVALTLVTSDILKLMAGLFAMIFALILIPPKFRIKISDQLTIVMGFFAGFLHSSISLGGPPIVLVLTGYGLDPRIMRRSLAILFFSLSVFSLPLFLWKNMLTVDRFGLGILSVPFIIIGGWIGDRISDKVPKKLFRIMTLTMVLMVGFQVVVSVWRK